MELASKRAGVRLAEAAVDRGHTNIRQNTPVQTQRLRDTLQKSGITYGPTELVGGLGIPYRAFAWTGKVWSEVEYAPFVELGTGLWGPKRAKYKIEPKKPGGVLVFTPYERLPGGGVALTVEGAPVQGNAVFVRFVMHPGSPGQHMFKLGTIITERELHEWAREPLRQWKKETEGRGLLVTTKPAPVVKV